MACAPETSPARSSSIRGKGKRLAVAEGEVTQDGRLVAKATVQFAVLE